MKKNYETIIGTWYVANVTVSTPSMDGVETKTSKSCLAIIADNEDEARQKVVNLHEELASGSYVIDSIEEARFERVILNGRHLQGFYEVEVNSNGHVHIVQAQSEKEARETIAEYYGGECEVSVIFKSEVNDVIAMLESGNIDIDFTLEELEMEYSQSAFELVNCAMTAVMRWESEGMGSEFWNEQFLYLKNACEKLYSARHDLNFYTKHD